MQVLYAYFKHDGESSLKKSEQELQFSINKSYDLYHYLFLLVIAIADYAGSRIDLARRKHIPTEEDLNPNKKFCENKIISQLRLNTSLLKYWESNKLSWVNNPELIRALYNKMVESEKYKHYMSDSTESYKQDKDFVVFLFKDIIAEYEPLYQALEEQSIYWNDEGEFIISANIKTITKMKEGQGENAPLMSLYKSDEDREFSVKLLRKVVLNHKDYAELIRLFSKNWEVDRIAFMDTLLMQMAIAEVIEFISIPTKVTLNEYLEVAKYYSTSRSNLFLNGILDKVFTRLKETNMIHKQGRGLIGDV
jgi:N utilization substance protein B